MNLLHEEILHDVLLNQRLTSKFWNLLPSKASRRMDEYNRRWKKFNLDAVALARKVRICLSILYHSLTRYVNSKTSTAHLSESIVE